MRSAADQAGRRCLQLADAPYELGQLPGHDGHAHGGAELSMDMVSDVVSLAAAGAAGWVLHFIAASCTAGHRVRMGDWPTRNDGVNQKSAGSGPCRRQSTSSAGCVLGQCVGPSALTVCTPQTEVAPSCQPPEERRSWEGSRSRHTRPGTSLGCLHGGHTCGARIRWATHQPLAPRHRRPPAGTRTGAARSGCCRRSCRPPPQPR